jgi:HEAT repeat protein
MQYRDEPVSYWLEQWQHPTGTTHKGLYDASLALACIGSTTMPALIDGLADPKRWPHVRAALSNVAESAVPLLLEAVGGTCRETREGAARALIEISLMGVKIPQGPLFAALRDPSPAIRLYAADVLLATGVAPNAVITVLLKVLEQGDDHVRFGVVWVASRAKSNDMTTIFHVAQRDLDPSVRAIALKSLLELAPNRHDLVSMLVKIIKECPAAGVDCYARNIAGTALAENEPAGRAALMELLEDDDATIARAAMWALGSRRMTSGVLEQCLNHPRAEVRREAAVALRRRQDDVRTQAGLLVKAMEDTDSSVRKAAAESLRYIDPPVDLILPSLRRLLGDEVEEVRVEAATSLAQLGSAGQKAIDVLLAALPGFLSSQNPKFSQVAKALRECHAEFDLVAPILFEAFDAGDKSDIQLIALETLQALGLPDAQVIQMATEMLADNTNEAADGAACLLAEMGAEGLFRLTEVLRHGNKHVRRRVMWAIRVIGQKDDAIVPILTGGLDDESALVREAAADAFGEMAFRRISPRLQSCMPLLTRALGDRDVAVRSAAAWALRRFGVAAAPRC